MIKTKSRFCNCVNSKKHPQNMRAPPKLAKTGMCRETGYPLRDIES